MIMTTAKITLAKALYFFVDITRYYVSVNGGTLKEITADQYSRYYKQGYTTQSSSERYQDRTMIFTELEIF